MKFLLQEFLMKRSFGYTIIKLQNLHKKCGPVHGAAEPKQSWFLNCFDCHATAALLWWANWPDTAHTPSPREGGGGLSFCPC